jgi:cystathionine beta-lyase/cystathionine gamma-synthase
MAAYQASFGARKEQVRISVGLEEVDVLVDTVRAALEVTEAAEAEGVEV